MSVFGAKQDAPATVTAGQANFQLPDQEAMKRLAVGFDAGGLSAYYGEGNAAMRRLSGGYSDSTINRGGKRRQMFVDSSADRKNLVNSLSSTYSDTAQGLRGLLPQIAPGVSNLRAAQLAEVENARSRTVGNLSETLSRRRVRGSSFANDSIARANAEFSQQAAGVAAATTLEELRLTTEYIQQIGALDAQAYATKLNEYNLQADIGLKLAASAQQVATSAANIATQVSIAQAKLDTEASIANASLAMQAQNDGSGELFGSLIGAAGTIGGAAIAGPAGAAIGGAAGSAVGGAVR
jgi:hypothetical protein